MFEQIHSYTDDAIEAVYARSAADSRSDKLDLSIGVYRDELGAVTVMDAVTRAEALLLSGPRPKGYVSPLGNRLYVEAVEQLVLGENHPALSDNRVVSAQGPGAGGMLRVGAGLIATLRPDATLWLSDPVWEHQIEFFSRAGVPRRYYRYYDRHSGLLRFDEMLADLANARAGDVVLIHGCCHNPTGADLSMAQWQQLADLCLARDLVPFVDVAYQGFGVNVEQDVAGVRLMAATVPEMLLAVSSSKSFTIYRERVGMLSLILSSATRREHVSRWLRDLIRGLYFMPPDHGAAVVAEILRDAELRRSWNRELDVFRERMIASRTRLVDALSTALPRFDFNFILGQQGMFSVLPLDAQQLDRLVRDHGIYLLSNGRLNFAALPEKHTPRVAQALAAVMVDHPSETGVAAVAV